MPVDFDWPKGKVWDGFLLPDSLCEEPCPQCYARDYRGGKAYGSGCTASYKWLDGIGRLIGMMAEDIADQKRNDGVPATVRVTGAGGVERMHPYLQELQRINIYEHRRPSADILELTDGILGPRERVSFGYSSDFSMKFLSALKAAAGLPDNWGTCPGCDGNGSVEKYPGQREEAENWEPTEPPTGEGWQVWETTSEGSPYSPVFADKEGLIGWLMSDAFCGFGTTPSPLSREQAERFVESAWAPTMVFSGGRLMSGAEFIGDAS